MMFFWRGGLEISRVRVLLIRSWRLLTCLPLWEASQWLGKFKAIKSEWNSCKIHPNYDDFLSNLVHLDHQRNLKDDRNIMVQHCDIISLMRADYCTSSSPFTLHPAKSAWGRTQHCRNSSDSTMIRLMSHPTLPIHPSDQIFGQPNSTQ